MPKKVLVVANRTVAGRKLLDAVRDRADDDTQFHLVVPMSRPRHGNVIYDDAARDAAQLRIDLASAYLGQEGIRLTGEIGDEDPFTATTDALAAFPADEVIVSTLPQTRSGWLRRDLIERIADASGLPIDHVVVDMAAEGLPFKVTLVVANRTASSDTLLEHLRKRAEADEARRLHIVVIPLEGGGGAAAAQARARKAQLLDRLRSSGMLAAGVTGDPDPYTATMNALQFFRVDDIVISTLPATRSGWLRADLIRRVANASNKPVEHIAVEAPTKASAAV